MRDKLMTMEQAIARVGKDIVEKLDNENCEPTGTVGYNGETAGDSYTEWTASTQIDVDGYNYLVAYYYTTNEQDAKMAANDGDGTAIEWEIAGYELA